MKRFVSKTCKGYIEKWRIIYTFFVCIQRGQLANMVFAFDRSKVMVYMLF